MTPQIVTVLSILTITVIFIVFEILRIDIVAILSMLSLAWIGIITPSEALSGFSSNAVIAMIAVMVMGKGLSDTGVMDKFSKFIIKMVGKSRRKLIGVISSSVGVMSSLMQNIGATALFLPAVLQISKKEDISPSKLIMPLGFSAIVGGTLTMVGTGSLIVLNDLLKQNNFEPFNFFDVTPVGIVLLIGVVLYFLIFGDLVLPSPKKKEKEKSSQKKLIETWHLPHSIYHYEISESSKLVGKSCENSNIWEDFNLNILAIGKGEKIKYAPWRYTKFEKNQKLAVLGNENDIKKFANKYNLIKKEDDIFDKLKDTTKSGFAEVIIPAKSNLVGKTIRQQAVRKSYDVEPVLFFSNGESYRGDFSDKVIKPGDTIIFYGLWKNLKEFKDSDDFVVPTPFEAFEEKTSKIWVAIASFAGAISLTFFTEMPISLCLLSGAFVMIIAGVIDIKEAYESIDWKVVFLIAGLIPLGIAMEKSNTAQFLAQNLMGLIKGHHPLIILLVVGGLTTVFSLFMSNVAATVLLVPLVLKMQNIGSIDPASLALLVGVCAANSFILPTHQVNAFLMTPGGYKNSDYLRAGGGLTVLFLILTVIVFYFVYI
ncbi:MAG: SLC13 family permease [Candidatus Mcinerneyibacterium aminivorans]|uniref:SLC13 family permease n=1 Tax=Candidatus Mcinerneyibacterium aminivorans TaxID=2703815 RepID=A0A5D0MNB8_9BACT|nr:MAG: SLC13 family permease [Candidatus Mcinerneyibacterium aminivorans]